MKRLMKLNYLILFVIGALSLGLISCDDDDDKNIIEPVAFVSLYQASPDAPPLDIKLDGQRINSYSFDYTDYTGYLRFYTGERHLSLEPNGADNVALDTMLTFDDQKAYSVFVVGEYPEIEVLNFEDNAGTPAAGNAMIRIINLSTDVSSVDLTADGMDDPLVDEQTFKEAPEYIEVDAIHYDFTIKDHVSEEVLLDVPDINLTAGYYYTIIVRGYQTPPVGNNNDLSAQIIVN